MHAIVGKPSILANGANNPSLCAVAEAMKHYKCDVSDIVLISIGTGHHVRPYPYSELATAGMFGWLEPLIDILFSSSSEIVDHHLKMMFDRAGCRNQYIRINGTFNENVEEDPVPDMDEASEENIEKLKNFGRSLYHYRSKAMLVLCKKIIERQEAVKSEHHSPPPDDA
ncbi:MAG: hypothetical protein AAGG48_31315 [Planctomycetota bacterium]